MISCNEEPQVACPFRDDSYACSSHLQDREIRAVSLHTHTPTLGHAGSHTRGAARGLHG